MSLPEIRTRATARIEVPVQFSRIRDIAYNLWWTWSPHAHSLFYTIDPVRWPHYRSPIELLIDLEPERWHELQSDGDFIRAYRQVVERFDHYMAPEEPTWFERRYPDHNGESIAYFSTEFGWHECLQMYSGGLGILSGDHSKSASDLGLPFIGIGLMYRHGYFRQTIDPEGEQQHFYPDYDLHRVPLLPVVDERDREIELALTLSDRDVRFHVWKAQVGRVPVLLLDTDLEINHPADREITSILYVRGREMRFCQEMVLGLGGVQLLRALSIDPTVWHMNEGHSALLSLQRLADACAESNRTLGEERERLAANAVFTTHTPVPAGNETFDSQLVREHLGGWAAGHGVDVEEAIGLGRNGDDDRFNMTVFALRTSARTNGVSELHGQVSGRMWNPLLAETDRGGVEHVTNGVHLPTWLGPEIDDLLRTHLGEDFEGRLLDGDFAQSVASIPDEELWRAHLTQKRRLVAEVRQRVLEQFARHGHSPERLRQLEHLFDPDVLLIGFARRFATYKRADLLLRDFDRLSHIVANEERPVQFVFAGKAHPADKPGQELIRNIWNASLQDKLNGRLQFLENYDMRLGRLMVQGVDVWLNNPRRPLEASGTSGMKAAMNGALNCSVLDGWWCEGYDPAHGWTLGNSSDIEVGDLDDAARAHMDHQDADSLYRTVADEVAPCYYDRNVDGIPSAWVQRMKLAIGQLSPSFSTERMVRDYTEKFYLGAREND